MNPKYLMTDISSLIAELERRKLAIELQEDASIQNLLNALKDHDRSEAKRRFELCLRWNELLELVGQWNQSLTNSSLLTYAVEGWFLSDLIQHLTPGADEEIAHVTGARIGSLRILSRLCPLLAEKKSPVYAKGTGQSCADTEIEILEHGNRLHAMAHSHPGSGASATRPSSTDIDYLGRIQRRGSEAIGVIVTRDGWVRFFSVLKPFRVFVMGSEITQTEEYVLHVSLSS